jgi:hypothetical protein
VHGSIQGLVGENYFFLFSSSLDVSLYNIKGYIKRRRIQCISRSNKATQEMVSVKLLGSKVYTPKVMGLGNKNKNFHQFFKHQDRTKRFISYFYVICVIRHGMTFDGKEHIDIKI